MLGYAQGANSLSSRQGQLEIYAQQGISTGAGRVDLGAQRSADLSGRLGSTAWEAAIFRIKI